MVEAVSGQEHPRTLMITWLEIHVDDEVLSTSPDRWPEARGLVEDIAALAQQQGASLSFRFRLAFAQAARSCGLLPALEAAGHEVGVHAHGRHLAQATEAVHACGIRPRVVVPGLVQVGAAGRSALLAQARALGFSVVTDHGPHPAWAYEGLAPSVEEGVLVMAPTVRPFDWGLKEPDGRRLGATALAFERLRRIEALAPREGAAWFGAALHEHDLCAPGSLRPLPGAMEALAGWLDARVRPAMMAVGELARDPGADAEDPLEVQRLAQEISGARAPLQPTRGLAARIRRSDRRVDLVRAVGMAVGQARQRLPPRRPGGPSSGTPFQRLRVGDRWIAVEHHGPADPRAIILMSHAGREGGRRLGLQPFGLGIRSLLDEGWALWLYDRSGTGDSPEGPHPGLTPGNPDHLDDWRAVLASARATGRRIVALTWSAGSLPVLAVAAGGEQPDAVIDGEGPADRWSLVPPGGNELSKRCPWEDAVWEGVEAVRLLPTIGCRYLRLQAELDHQHGAMTAHARRATAAAGVELSVLPGRLHGHPEAVLEAIRRMSR